MIEQTVSSKLKPKFEAELISSRSCWPFSLVRPNGCKAGAGRVVCALVAMQEKKSMQASKMAIRCLVLAKGIC